jgi:hypothetical protein
LVEEAERSARGEEEQKEGEETEIDEVKDKDEDEIMADIVDEAIDETEAEENTPAKGISEPEALSSI